MLNKQPGRVQSVTGESRKQAYVGNNFSTSLPKVQQDSSSIVYKNGWQKVLVDEFCFGKHLL